ncbi:MAG: 2-oxoglutarate dehydrogenase complex dihydrolipoyllysine-residue succinyltransferase [Pseudomonadota bacterium]|nr:2-oxoglutarate dehydrogenase complex dihydrolipoyllysine-residue succinyltransferase [Pseudomonadota bacterium]
MLVEVKVPQLAESVTEATLLEWQKQQGDRVERGDNLIDIETDKVVLEVTAADSGVLKEIRKNSGEDVQSNDVIAIIDTEAGAAMSRSAREPSTQAAEETPLGVEQQAQPQPSIKAGRQLRQVAPEGAVPAPSNGQADTPRDQAMPVSDTGSMPAVDVDSEREARLGPAVRKLLQEHQLDPREIEGSGKDGRITKADVLSYLETQPAEEVQPRTQKIARAPIMARGFEGRPERRVAMTRLRKRVAERLLQAQSENAILTTFNEVDMQPVLTLRKRYREQFEKVHGVRLGFMGFFVLASIEALKRFPIVNASVDGNDIIYHGYFDIGIAVSSPRGLVVPILRDAQRLTVAEIEKAIAEFGRKAKDNTLALEELAGGTFTITNGGVFGSLLSTPILNPPQSAILGMHKIEERPIARDGQVIVRPMMYLALSYDHRVIDGREAVQFLVTIKEQLEDPSRLLLQI